MGGANSPTTGTLTFTVDDGVGGQGLDPQDPIDSISINAGLVVEEATSTTTATVISTSELQYTVTAGAYTYPTSQIVYTVSVLPTNGTLYVDGTALSAYGSFTQADIDAGLVTFLQDGSEDHESEFTYTVTNGGDFTAIDTFSIDATPVNDAPVASDSSVSVIEKTVDGTGIVRITDLVMTDADGSEEGLGDEGATDDLWFQISLDDLSGGTLQVWDGSEWMAASEDVWYSQDILSADADGETSGLRYVHDGGESTDELNDSFTFIVRDDLAAPSDPFDTDTSTPTDNGLETSNVSNTGTVTIAVTPFNDAPMIPLTADAADQTVTNAAGVTTTSANNPLALGEGEIAVITNSLLQAVDSDNTTRQSTYVVESLPENGTLLVSGKTLRVGSSFTQADIDSGLLSYEHDGGETRSDDFTFTVSDGPLTTDEATFDIVITPLDDSPEITGTQPEDKLIPASTALSALDLGGAFVIGDVDILDAESGLGVDAAETDSIKVSLSLKDEDGAIVPFTTAVLTALPSGADSTVITDANTLVIEGTLEAVQASLDTLSVQMVLDPISGEEDPDQRWTLEAVVDDRLGDGSLNGGSANEGGAAIGEDFNTVTANVELWASTENDAPVVTLPDTTELVVTEDGGYQDIGTITVTDADSFDEDVTVVLSVPAGNLQITAAGDAVVSGNQSGTITVIGTVTDIKAALKNIQYQPDENDNGTVELTVTATDTDLHGDGTAITTTATTDITITAVNDVPLLTVPTETLVMDDGQPLTISGISVADDNDFGQDVYNDVQTVMVTVEQGEAFADGTLDLVAGIGLTVSGQETGVLELTGTLADLNAALATLEFTAADINDDKSAKLNITFNDEGNGDPTQENAQEESASASITINVSGENDAPTITSATPEAGVLNEDSSLNLSALGVVLNDPDDFGADNLTLTLTVQHGTFNDGTSNVTLTGTEAQLQAALNAETYTADGDYYGEDILGITFNDGGNTGLIAGTNESGEQEVSRNITLTVTSVNDRPVSDGADESVVAINEDTADANISGTDLLTLLNDQYSDTTDDQTQENGLTAASEETPLTYVAITGNSSTSNQGTWQVLIGSDWIDIPAGLSDSSALVVSADADIRFVLADDFNGVPGALAVRLGDGSDLGINTSDSASDLFDLADEPNGNLGDQASVWSDALIAIGTSVIETNDAPAIPDDSVTLAAIDEDVTDSEGDTVANLMGGNFDDASADDQTDEAVSGGSEADSFAGVAIISSPSIDTEGTWQYSTDAGATWIDVPDDVSDSNALVLTTTDSLRFVPAENYHGAPTGLDYVVADDSSGAVTSESRVDASTFDQAGIWSDAASAATLNTTVNPINDAPVLTGSTAPEAFAISVVENSGPGTGSAEVALVSEASLSDIDTALVGDNFGGGTITITIDTATNFDIFSVDEALDGFANADLDDGTLTVALASGATAAQVAALVNSLTYQNVSDDPDTTTRAYTVVVNDGNNDGLSEDESGGDASLDSNILTGYLKVVDTNDDPVAVNDAGITDEDTALAVEAENGVLSNDTDLDTPEEDFVVSQVNGSDGNVGQLVAGSTGGSFTLNQDGSWSFTPDGDFEGLKAGESAVTTVTYQVSDGEGGVSTATVSVTVNGVDDIPTLIADTGAVTEDTNVTDGDLTTSGTLAAGTDGDTGEDKFTAETLAGIYGELTVDADGNWTYSADNAQDAIQQLNQGATLTDSLTVTNADGVTTTTVDITITGVNDAPVAVADIGTTSENSDLVVAAVDGVLSNDTDIDQGSTKTVSQVAGAGTGVDASVAMTGGGSITIAADGSYTFVPGADFDYLAAGESATTTIAYTVQDDNGAESSSTLTITVTGTNDIPTLIADTGAVTEDTNVTDGDLTTSGTLDAGTDGDAGEDKFTAETLTGTYGELVVDADGNWTYSADNTQDAIQQLNQGATLTDSITVTNADGVTTTTVDITITGVNDAPVAVADTGTTAENTDLVVAAVDGVLSNDTDIDQGSTKTVSQVAGAGTGVDASVAMTGGGSITIAADGSYTFSPGTDFDYLAVDETATTTVAYTVQDDNGAESSSTLTITVTGTNDAPTVVEVQQDQTGVDGQAITPFDVVDLFADTDDGAELSYAAADLPEGLSIDPSTGIISGTLTSDASQGGIDGVHTVTLTATDENDASVTTTFTWTVANVDPVAQDNSDDVAEGLATDSVSTANGNVISDAGTDSDGGNDDDVIVVSGVGVGENVATDTAAGVAVDGSYGAVVIAADGSYTYTLDNANSAVQALDVGDSLVETFTYQISDGQGGLATALLTLTINGTNDAPVAVADATATNEDTALTVADTTNVLSNDTDVDDASSLSVRQVNGNAGSVGQPVTGSEGGSFVLNEDGSWSFDPAGDFEDLKAGESAVSTITYQVSDGEGGLSTATVSVTINGVDDIPTLTADSGNVTEDTAVDADGNLIATGTLVAGTGGDAGEDKFTAETLAGTYGELVVDADGNWTYSADNAQDAIQQLNQGATLTDSITVTNADGVTTTTVDITITGVNDAPVAVVDSGATTENVGLTVAAVDGVLANDTDIDTGSTSAVSQVAGAAGGVGTSVAMTGGGAITIDADGGYTFVPGADFDNLAVGETATTVVAYTVQDDNGAESSSTLTITVTGTNDAPVVVDTQMNLTGVDGQAITAFDVVDLFADVDDGAVLAYTATELPDGLSLNASTGVISGTLSSDASQGGTEGVHTVTLTATDDQGAIVTTDFTWTVANVDPIAQDNADSLEEGTAIDSISTTEGNVITDAGVDSDGGDDNDTLLINGVGFGANVATDAAAGEDVDGDYGSLAIASNGAYVYTLDNSSAAVQALDVGDTLVETFTYEISDGQGGVATALLTITINGSNDAPVLVDGAQPVEQSDADGEAVTPLDVSGAFTDVDADASLTYSAANLPDGLSIDPDTGVISGTLTSDASQGGTEGAHDVVITVTDDQNASVTTTFIWNVANVDPIAQDNTNALDEGLETTAVSTTGGNVLTDAAPDASVDSDGGNDADELSVSGVGAGQAIVDGATSADGTFGSITLDGTGEYLYTLDNTNDAVQALAVGETLTDTISYEISDGQGGTDTAELTITINGTNDAPVITLEAGDSAGASLIESDAGLSASGTLSVADVDTTDSVTPSITAVATTGDINGLSEADLLAMLSVDDGAVINGTDTQGTLNWDFDSSALPTAFDHLALGEVLTLTYTVEVADGQGGSDSQDITLTITGSNDAPVLVADAQPVDQAYDDGDAITPFSVSDAFADVDNDAVLTFAAANLPAGLSIDAETGDISGTLTSDASQGGDDGDGIYTVILTSTDENGAEVTTSFTWTVANVAPEAENDAAFIDEGASATDDSAVSGNVLGALGAGDNDQADSDGGNDNDALVVSGIAFGAVPATLAAAGSDVDGNYGSLIINADGTYTYDLNNANEDVQALAVGEVLSETFTYQISDAQDGVDTALLTITINGTNDAPVISIEGDDSAAETLTESDTTLATAGTLSVSDLDTTDIVTPSVASVTATGDTDGLSNAQLLGMLSVDAEAIIADTDNDGTLNWAFDSASVAGEAFDHLAVGESLVLDYTVVVTDSQGATAEQVVQITINGTNDEPVIAIEGDDSAAETLTESDATLATSGTLSVSDLDTTDEVTPSVAAVTATGDTDGLSNAELLGMLSVDADAIIDGVSNDGTLNWAFDSSSVAGEAFDHLAMGESLVLDYTVVVTDSQGATAEQVVSITINGTNDAPVLVAGQQPADQSDDDGDPITPFSVADAFTDIDNDAVLTFTAGNLPEGLVIDLNSGEISGTLSPDASQGGDDDDGIYTVILTGTDENGAFVTTSFSWTVANVAPEAFDNTAELEEGIATGDTSTTEGNVITDSQPGTDSDGGNDSDVLVVSGVGFGANVATDSDAGTPVPGSFGSVSIADDGSYTYTLDNTNAAVQALAAGESLSDTFTYEISDGQGGVATALLTVTINATNDAPVISIEGDDSAAESLTESDATLATAGTLSVSDLDTTDVVTPSVAAVVATGDTDGLSNEQLLTMLSVDAEAIIDGVSNDGTLNWVFDSASVAGEAFDHLAVGESLVLDYTVVVTDSQGATAEQVVQITINGTNDAPVITIEGDDSAAESLTESDAALATAGTLSVSDLDTTDVVTPSVAAVVATGDTDGLSNEQLLTMLSVDAEAIIGDAANDGTLNWAFDSNSVAGEAFDHLAVGESLVLDYTVVVTDSQGATAEQVVSITINGSNDAPVIAIEGDDSAAESLTESDATLATAGTLSVSDLDTTDVVTPSVAAVVATGDTDGLSNAELLGMLSVDAEAIIANTDNDGTLNWTFDSASVAGEAFDHLAVGESLVLDYTVVVTDSQGVTAEQVVQITISGSNDAPVIAIEGDDSAAESLIETDDTLSTAGTLSISDLDTTDVVTPSVASVTATGDTDGLSNAELLSMLSVDAEAIIANTENDGTLNWTFDSASVAGEAFDHLAVGESLVLDYTVVVTDSQGATAEQVVSITINGTNDAPVIAIEGDDSAAESLTESDATLATAGTLSVSDLDTTDVVTPSVAAVVATGDTDGLSNAELLGMLSVDAEAIIDGVSNDGTLNWAFDSASVAGEAFDHLAVGESLVLDYTVVVTDSQGATAEQVVSITINGTNDAPVIAIEGDDSAAESLIETDDTLSTAGTLSISDLDTTDVVTPSVASVTATGDTDGLSNDQLLSMLSVDAEAIIDGVSNDGTLNWAFDSASVAGEAFDHLAVGESLVLDYTVVVTDSQGATAEQVVSITINGTNDAPVIAIEGDDSAAESLTQSDATLATAGTLSVSDLDTTDVVTPSVAAVVATGDTDGLSNEQLLTMLSVDAEAIIADTDNDGTLNWAFDSASVAGEAFDHLAVGESLVLDYTVVVTDSQGATAEQVVQITINGTNDAPVIAIEGDDSAAESLTESDATLATAGTLSVSDLDTTDVVTPSVAAVVATGDADGLSNAELLGMLSVDADAIIANTDNDGTLNWTFDSSSVEGEAFDHLAVGESLVLDYTVVVTDSQGATAEQVVSITINGTNDAPVIAIEGDDSAAESLTESDATLSTSGTLSISDLDTTDDVTPSVTAVTATGDTDGLSNAELLSMLSVDADAIIDGVSNDGTLNWTFDSASVEGEAFDHLAVGESLVLDYTVVVTDSQGATAEQVVQITINGTNDAPVIAIEGDDSAAESLTQSDATLATAGTLSVSDLDTTDVVTPSVAAVVATGDTDGLSNAELLTMLSVDAEAIIADTDNDGTLNWAFDSASVAGEAFDHLAVGESLVLDYTVVVTDSQGATAEQVVSITINGTNDAPVIAIEGDDSAAESLTETDATLTTAGTLSVSDLDTTDEVTPSVTAVTATGDTDGLSNAELLSMLSVDADAIIDGVSNDGTLNWTFDSSNVAGEAFDHLAVGESLVLDYTVVVTDSQGVTAEQVVSITINGSNDAPVLVDGEQPVDQSGNDGDPITAFFVADAFTDIDNVAELSFSADNLPEGLVIAPATGEISGTLSPDASTGGDDNDGIYTVTLTGTDENGAEVTTTFTWTVVNVAPQAFDNIAELDEGVATGDTSTTNGNVLTEGESDIDGGNDTDTLIVSGIGAGANAGTDSATGTPVVGTFGSVTIAEDGSYTYALDNTNAAVQALAEGEVLSETFTYEISDGQSGTDTALLTVTINGTNDAPRATLRSPGIEVGSDGEPVSPVNLQEFFEDIDNDSQLTFSAEGLPAGLIIDPVSGVISGVLSNDASQQGNTATQGLYSVTATATDEEGLHSSISLSYYAANVAPQAFDNIAELDEGVATGDTSTTNGNVLTDGDADIDGGKDTDTLIVSGIGAGANAGTDSTAGTPVTGTYGSVTIADDGSYTYTLDNTNASVQALADGEVLTETFTYQISDGQGGTDTALLTVTINGTNDAPVLVEGAQPADQAANDGEAITPFTIADAFTDVDNGAELTFRVENLPQGLVIDPATGEISGTLSPDASQGGDNDEGIYTLTVTATDAEGNTASTTFTYKVSNPIPEALDQSAEVSEDGVTSAVGNVLVGADGEPLTIDVDGDSVTIASVNGQSVDNDQTVIQGTYGQLTIASDGAWRYELANNTTAVQALEDGQRVTDSFGFVVSDGQGGIAVGQLSLNVTGLSEPVVRGTTGIPPVTVTSGFVPDNGSDGDEVGRLTSQEDDREQLLFSDSILLDIPSIQPVQLTIILRDVVANEAVYEFSLPAGAFESTNNEEIKVEATRADGSSLPGYVAFDSDSLSFRVNRAMALSLGVERVDIKVTGRDESGNEASTTFVIYLTPKQQDEIEQETAFDAETSDEVPATDSPSDGEVGQPQAEPQPEPQEAAETTAVLGAVPLSEMLKVAGRDGFSHDHADVLADLMALLGDDSDIS